MSQPGEASTLNGGPSKPVAFLAEMADPNARLIAAAPELLAALDNIVANAKVIPDPAMEGTTDTYSVPLDDIEAARAILAKAYGR